MSAGKEALVFDPKNPRRLIDESLTEQIIGAAIEVHRYLGGLLESAYEDCLRHQLQLRGLSSPCFRGER